MEEVTRELLEQQSEDAPLDVVLEKKANDTEKPEQRISSQSWMILRRHEIEAISRFLSVAEKSISRIKDVILNAQSNEKR